MKLCIKLNTSDAVCGLTVEILKKYIYQHLGERRDFKEEEIASALYISSVLYQEKLSQGAICKELSLPKAAITKVYPDMLQVLENKEDDK